jgi:hypothetical protein
MHRFGVLVIKIEKRDILTFERRSQAVFGTGLFQPYYKLTRFAYRRGKAYSDLVPLFSIEVEKGFLEYGSTSRTKKGTYPKGPFLLR